MDSYWIDGLNPYINWKEHVMKAIVFDFDGTLANTLPICFYAFQVGALL